MRTRVMGIVGLWIVVATGCKAELTGGPLPTADIDAPPASDDDASDPTVDAPVPLGPWSAAMPVPGASDPAIDEDDPVMTDSGLEIYFALTEANGEKHLYRMKRDTLADPWSMPARLAINVAGAQDQTPRVSPNGKTLYFASTRPGGPGNADIYMATRQTPNDEFANATLMPAINAGSIDRWYTPCADGNYVLLSERNNDGDEDLYEGSATGGPTQIPISSENNERGVTLTPDCLTMYFGSNQGGAGFQLYTTTRAAIGEPWPEETAFTEIGVMGSNHEDPWIAPDGRTFLVTVETNGNKDVYIATR